MSHTVIKKPDDFDRLLEPVPYRSTTFPYLRSMLWNGAGNDISPGGLLGWIHYSAVRTKTFPYLRTWLGAIGAPDGPNSYLGEPTAHLETHQLTRSGLPLCESTSVFYSPNGSMAYSWRPPGPTPEYGGIEPHLLRGPYTRTGLAGLNGLPFADCSFCSDHPQFPAKIPEILVDYHVDLGSGGGMTGTARMFGSCTGLPLSDGGQPLTDVHTSKFSDDCCEDVSPFCYDHPFPGRKLLNNYAVTYTGGDWVGTGFFVCIWLVLYPYHDFGDFGVPLTGRYGFGAEMGFDVTKVVGNAPSAAEVAAATPGVLPWCDCGKLFKLNFDRATGLFFDEPVGCAWAGGSGWGGRATGDACNLQNFSHRSASGYGVLGNPDWCWNFDPRDDGGVYRNPASCLGDGSLYPDYTATYNFRHS